MQTVLIVDDSATMRAYCRKACEPGGYAVVEASNGVEALEKALAAEAPFALMFVDINMPQMDGYRFVQEVRAEPALMAVPIVMMSTESEPSDVENAYRSGANCYLVKPVSAEAFGPLLRLLAEPPSSSPAKEVP